MGSVPSAREPADIVHRPARLTRRADFVRVQEAGRAERGRLLVCVWSSGLGVTLRLGLTVSRKVGNAVTRNRVRRRLRAILWPRLAGSAKVIDCVFIARPAASTATYRALERECDELIQRMVKRWALESCGPS